MAELDEVLGKERFPVTIGGKEYTAKCLTIGDLGEFRAHVKESRIRLLLKVVKDGGMDSKVLSDGIDRIMSSRATLVTRKDEDGKIVAEVDDPIMSEIATEEGMRYLVWLSIRKTHPKLKLSEVDLPMDELATLSDIVRAISGIRGEEETPENPSLDDSSANESAEDMTLQ